MKSAYAPPPEAVRILPTSIPLLDEKGKLRTLEEIKRAAILAAILHCGGHMSEVTRQLKIGRSTLYRKLKDMEGAGFVDLSSPPPLLEPAAETVPAG